MKKTASLPGQTPSEFQRLLDKCRPEDFDGHTDFQSLTPAQKLDALAGMAAFVHKYKGIARKTKRQ